MISFNEQLIMQVYSVIKKGEYPTPIPNIDKEIDSKFKEYNDLRCGIGRPSTKTEYINLLTKTLSEYEELVKKNAIISETNNNARRAVDIKYESDLETAKLIESNKGAALAKCVDEQLNETLWYTAKDCGLTTSQQAIADKWRADMMAICSMDNIDNAIEAFSKLLSTKPMYQLKWKV